MVIILCWLSVKAKLHLLSLTPLFSTSKYSIFKLKFTVYFLDPVICQSSFPYAESWPPKLPKGNLQTPDCSRGTTAGKLYTHACPHGHTQDRRDAQERKGGWDSVRGENRHRGMPETGRRLLYLVFRYSSAGWFYWLPAASWTEPCQAVAPTSSHATPPGMLAPWSSALTHNCHTVGDGCICKFQGENLEVKLIATARQKSSCHFFDGPLPWLWL